MDDDRGDQAQMKWGLKTSRDIASGIIKIHELVQVPNRTEPYSMKYRNGLVESLQVFGSRAAAKEAYENEKEAASFTLLPDEEVQNIAREALAYFKRAYRIPVEGVATMLDVPRATLRAYYEGRRMNPRIVLRVLRLKEYIDAAAKKAAAVLPDSGSTGNPAKGRGGNPDIWRSAPHRRKQTA